MFSQEIQGPRGCDIEKERDLSDLATPLFYPGTSKRDHNVRTNAPLGLEENRESIDDEAIALKMFPRDYVYHLQYVKV